jgi:cytochrome c-type biogenesis protein CcmH
MARSNLLSKMPLNHRHALLGLSRRSEDSRGAPFLASFARSGGAQRRITQTVLLCAAIFVFLGAGDPGTRFQQIGHQMMCICGCNQILLECNHVGCPASDGMRNELMAAVSRGDSDSLVEQSFVQKYGPTVLAAPTTKGFDRAAYIMPFAALFLGFGLIGLVVRSWKNRPAPAIADGLTPASGAEIEQFRDQARKETDI